MNGFCVVSTGCSGIGTLGGVTDPKAVLVTAGIVLGGVEVAGKVGVVSTVELVAPTLVEMSGDVLSLGGVVVADCS